MDVFVATIEDATNDREMDLETKLLLILSLLAVAQDVAGPMKTVA